MLRWGVSTKVEMLHPCNIDPLVPELVRREPHNTHTCQSTECTAKSYACSQTNYIISLPPEKKIVVMCIKTLSLSFTSRAMNAWCQCFWPQLRPGRGCLHKRLWSTSQPRQTPPSQSSWLGHPPGLCDVSNSWGIESGPVILHLPVTQELGHSRITLTDSFSRTMARTHNCNAQQLEGRVGIFKDNLQMQDLCDIFAFYLQTLLFWCLAEVCKQILY